MKLSVKVIANENGGYTALCPSLPGCISRGKTQQLAAENIHEAIKGYLAAVSNFVPENLSVYQAVES